MNVLFQFLAKKRPMNICLTIDMTDKVGNRIEFGKQIPSCAFPI